MHVVIVKDQILALCSELLFRKRFLLGGERNGKDLIRYSAPVVVPRLKHEAHGMIFRIDQIVGQLQGRVQALQSRAVLPFQEQLEIFHCVVSPFGHVDLLEEVLQIADLTRNHEAPDTVGQIIGAGLHIGSRKLGSDIPVTRLFHSSISVCNGNV